MNKEVINMTVKQKSFLKEFRNLLLKYNVKIGWNRYGCGYIHMIGQKDIGIFNDYVAYNLEELGILDSESEE